MIHLTDMALRQIDTHILAFEPERGGALLGPAGRPLISCFVADPSAQTTATSYKASDDLRERVRQLEVAGLECKGIIHSHPPSMPHPSATDLATFADSLAINPHLGSYIVPIAVRRQLPDSDSVVAGSSGSIAMWVARLTRDGKVECLERPVRVIPVSELARLVGLEFGDEKEDFDIEVVEIGGSPQLMTSVSDGEGRKLRIACTESFPSTPPIVFSETINGGEEPVLEQVCFAWRFGDELDTVAGEICRAALVGTSKTHDKNFARSGITSRTEGLLDPTIRDKHVTCVGLGSVGSRLVEGLARAGVERFTLIDHDLVEASNLSRSIYTTEDLGRPKVSAAASHLRLINPAAQVNVLSRTVDQVGTFAFAGLCRTSDLIIAATDDPAAQRLIDFHAHQASTPAIHPGLYEGARGGEIVVSVPGQTPCLLCTTSTRHTRSETGASRINYGTGRLHGEIALGADIALVTAAATKLALSIVSAGTDAATEAFARRAIEDGVTYVLFGMEPDYSFFGTVFESTPAQFAFQSLWVSVERNPECPVCGEMANRSGLASLTANRPSVDRIAAELKTQPRRKMTKTGRSRGAS